VFDRVRSSPFNTDFSSLVRYKIANHNPHGKGKLAQITENQPTAGRSSPERVVEMFGVWVENRRAGLAGVGRASRLSDQKTRQSTPPGVSSRKETLGRVVQVAQGVPQRVIKRQGVDDHAAEFAGAEPESRGFTPTERGEVSLQQTADARPAF
jgi:hypothetical protein